MYYLVTVAGNDAEIEEFSVKGFNRLDEAADFMYSSRSKKLEKYWIWTELYKLGDSIYPMKFYEAMREELKE